MGALLAITAIILFLWGCAGLLAPKFCRLRTRWVAASLIIISTLILALSIIADPQNLSPKEANSSFVVLLIFWMVVFLLILFIRIAWRANCIKQSEADLPPHWLDFAARPWGNMARRAEKQLGVMREKQRAEKMDAPVIVRGIDSPPPPPPPPPVPRYIPPPRKAVAQYYDNVESKPAKSDSIDADTINAPTANKGRTVWIAYVDSNGEITEREVTNWVMTRVHLEGFCLLRKRKRLFRRDRIIEWGEWA